MSKVRRGTDKVCRCQENGVCVSCGVNYWARRDSWRRETWFKCVSCGKWAHESCGSLDPVNCMCIGLLATWTIDFNCVSYFNLRFLLKIQVQPLVGLSSPYCGDMWRRYCCLTSFFRLSIHAFSCEDIAGQNCALVPRPRFFAEFFRPEFQRAACSMFQTCILNSHWGHTMCGSMADIQSATAEIRRGKKIERRRRRGRKRRRRINHRAKI